MPLTNENDNSVLDSVFGTQEDQLKISVEFASTQKPDEFVRNKQLSEKTGLHPEMVEHDKPEAERREKIQDADLDGMRIKYPNLAKYMTDPQKAASIMDDLDSFKEYESLAVSKPWYDTSVKGVGDSFMINMGKLYDQTALAYLGDPRTEEEFNELIEQKFSGDELEQIKSDNVERLRKVEYHKASLKTAEDKIKELTPDNMTIFGESVRGAINFLGDMALPLTLSAATKGKVNVTLPYLTAKSGLSSFGESMAEGKEYGDAVARGGIDAMLEYVTEKLPTKTIEKAIEGLSKGGVAKSMGKWFMQEAVGEQIATATQSLNAYAFQMDKQLSEAKDINEVMEIQGRRQLVTLGTTILGGGALSGTMKATDYAVNRKNRADKEAFERVFNRTKSEQGQEWLDNAVYLAQDSIANERSSESFAEFVNNIDPDMNVYIGADALLEIDDLPQDLLDQIDGTGSDVVMTLDKFLSSFAKDESIMAQIKDDIKVRPDLHTKRELSEDNDKYYINRLMENATAEKETKDAADQYYKQYTEQLIATGRMRANEASQSAELIPSLVATQYENLKSNGTLNKDGSEITMEQLFEDVGIKIIPPSKEMKGEFLNQDEQSEYDAAVAKGLDMTEEARMSRAEDMGYDLEDTQYHYSRKSDDITEIKEGNLNLSLLDSLGIHTGTKDATTERSMSTRSVDPNTGTFVDPMGATFPVLIKKGNKLTKDDGSYYTESELSAVLDLELRKETNGESWDRESKKEFRDIIWGKYDSIPYINEVENRGSISYITPPSNARSINAAFDPDHKESAKILAQGQDFGDLEITRNIQDEVGNEYEITQSANELWDITQDRLSSLEQLKGCISG